MNPGRFFIDRPVFAVVLSLVILVVGGIADAVVGLEAFRFSPDDVDYLAGLGLFTGPFLDTLADLRFSGELWAMPEGEVAYPGEPLVRVTGPLVEAARSFLASLV